MNEWIKEIYNIILSRAKNGGNHVICNNTDKIRGRYEMAGWHHQLDVHESG